MRNVDSMKRMLNVTIEGEGVDSAKRTPEEEPMMMTRRVEGDVYRFMANGEILSLGRKTEVSFQNCKTAGSDWVCWPGLQWIAAFQSRGKLNLGMLGWKLVERILGYTRGWKLRKTRGAAIWYIRE